MGGKGRMQAVVNVTRKRVQTLCREELFDVELESLFSNMETQAELPCSASVRISAASLVVALSPSPAASHISSWLSTLYPDPPRSVEKKKRVFSEKACSAPEAGSLPRAVPARGTWCSLAAALHRHEVIVVATTQPQPPWHRVPARAGRGHVQQGDSALAELREGDLPRFRHSL